MLNFSPDRTDPRALAVNQSAIERHVDDDHYVRRFTPGEFVLGGAAGPTHTIVTAATPHFPAIIMPKGGTSTAASSFERPSEWRTGHLRIIYWYTSPVGSTNNFRMQVAAQAIRSGEVLVGTALMGTFSSVPGPAVADTVIRATEQYTATALGSDDELFSLRIIRLGADAADTNANELHLLYVRVEHIPSVQVGD